VKTVFFDLDGTLTDPKEGITASIQFALQSLGAAVVPSQDELTWCIGPPLRGSFAQMLGDQHADAAVTLYRQYFADTGLYQNFVYQGVDEVLTSLQARGTRLCVVSSKPHVYVTRILQHFGLTSFFSQVFGAELDGTRSDKGELLAHALAVSGADATASIMIGDRKHDAVGAAANNLKFIGVLYGYGSRAELLDAGAQHLAQAPLDIPQLIDGLD